MSYSGYLIKIGDYKIPHKYIKADSYQAYVNMQDVDPWTDANGYLHRKAVKLKALKVEFETKALLTNKDFASLMSNIRANITDADARKCKITAYIPELDKYETQTGYMADFTPQIYFADENVVKYDPIRLAFIGGVYG